MCPSPTLENLTISLYSPSQPTPPSENKQSKYTTHHILFSGGGGVINEWKGPVVIVCQRDIKRVVKLTSAFHTILRYLHSIWQNLQQTALWVAALSRKQTEQNILPLITMPKRKCCFTDDFQNKLLHLLSRLGKMRGGVRLYAKARVFPYKGAGDLKAHMDTEKHKIAVRSESSPTKLMLSNDLTRSPGWRNSQKGATVMRNPVAYRCTRGRPNLLRRPKALYVTQS